MKTLNIWNTINKIKIQPWAVTSELSQKKNKSNDLESVDITNLDTKTKNVKLNEQNLRKYR